ncbi:unnamed protein product [Parnassius mnemosyne]|uniref:MADF domain-containing protein n=1 Tax=Parnassius mnemosyne TaxID=213953 RepID=A0AAV1MBB0_9NEOP
MEADAEYIEEAGFTRSRSPSPLPPNVLQPEKDFILNFEALPELWDTKNPGYTNKYKRNENLAKLLPILRKIKKDATIDDVKKKINSIRSNYRRELKKIVASKRSGAGADDIYNSKIWYFPYLHFLRKLEQPVALLQESNQLNQEPLTSETEQINQEGSEHQQSNQNNEVRSFSSISAAPKPYVSSQKKKKLNYEELIDRACRYLSEPCNTHTNQNVNLTNPIALEWSNTLERLDPIQRLYAKKAINDILFEAELGNLNRDSVKTFTTLTPPPPPPPSSMQTPSPASLPLSSPQDTASVTFNINSQHYSPYSDSTLTSPPPPLSPLSQQTLTSPAAQPLYSLQHTTSQTSHQISSQQHSGHTISTTPYNFTSLQRGTPSQIILNANYNLDQPSQIPASTSKEYILHIPNDPNITPSPSRYQNKSNNIVSLFSHFKP